MGKSLQALYSWQILSSAIWLNGEHLQLSLHRCSTGLWLCHSRTFRDLPWSHSSFVLAVHFRSCWNAERWTFTTVWDCVHSGAGFPQGLYLCAFIPLLILTNLPVPTTEKHPHSTMLTPPCFTIRIVFARWWALPGYYQLEFNTKKLNCCLIRPENPKSFKYLLYAFYLGVAFTLLEWPLGTCSPPWPKPFLTSYGVWLDGQL